MGLEITLRRISTGDESTIGALYIDNKFECYVLEDTKRDVKVMGETRIPDGTYVLALRNDGGMTRKYAYKYPDMHKGMLWLLDVPKFKYVYIHTGNKKEHTDGCLLVGDSVNNNQLKAGFVGSSKDAYTRIYPRIADAIESGAGAKITIINIG